MPDTPFTVDQFGGLDLAVDPFQVGAAGAVSAVNVALDMPGRVRTRNGYAKFNTTTPASSGYSTLFSSPLNGGCLLALRYSSGGSVALDTFTAAGLGANIGSFAAAAATACLSNTPIGTPTSSLHYFSVFTYSTTGLTLRKTDGSTLSAGTGKPLFVATSPASNRLVQGGYFAAGDSPTGANGSRSTVFFSDAGAPDTYSANNFVALHPGDGETITAIITWRELIFVFKQTAMYVFYGESTDSAGNPIFNYRRVDLPSTITDPTQAPVAHRAVATPDGVFFTTIKGLYVTTGGVPQYASRPVERIFSADPSIPSTTRADVSSGAWLSWAGDELILSYLNVANADFRHLVWNPATTKWALWDLQAFVFTSIPAVSATSATSPAADTRFWVSADVSDNDIHIMRRTDTTDGGTAISWSHQSGRYPLANPGAIAITRESALWGVGTVTLALDTDLYATQSGVVTLGASDTAEGWLQKDQEGHWFQHTLSGTGPASVSRITHYVSSVRGTDQEN